MIEKLNERIALFRQQRASTIAQAEKDIYAIDTVIAEYEHLIEDMIARTAIVEPPIDAPEENN